MKRWAIFCVWMLMAGSAIGAEPRRLDFTLDVLPVLTRAGCNSGNCHGALAGKGGLKLSLRGYDPESDHHALVFQAGGRRVDRAIPNESLMLRKPAKLIAHGGGKRFETDSEEYRRLARWIADGASKPDPRAPALTALEVRPRSNQLKVKDTRSLEVRARYADGRTETVSKWTRFASSNESVAAVDEYGQVEVTGPGEAAINVFFGNRVASAIVSSPFERHVEPEVYAKSPRHNFIDEFVLDKLAGLNIPPSDQADDRTWIRRVYLDCIGTLPTADEVDRFARNGAGNKREALVDALLRRPEYVGYWSYKWCDLLLVSTQKLQQSAVWAFSQSVRTAVAANQGWDAFARDIVTSRGSTLTHGLGNYFVIHKDPAELTESTALTFLGVSLACARCHNHPLEKWTQDQYWSFANVFGQVSLKSGERGGEAIITDSTTGDIPHLRRGVPMPPTPPDGTAILVGVRRNQFADWLTQPENPFFGRAIVNRVWKNFMGRGLVEVEDDFRQTNPASHPELLDALAQDFARHHFDVKHLIRTITRSAAYQRSSRPVPGNEVDDRYFSRYILRRLPAEVILDAYSQLTGVPTSFDEIYTTNHVPTNTALYPKGIRAQQLPDAQVVSRFLESFGRPAREQTCSCERQSEATIGQALHLHNGRSLNDKLRAKGSVLDHWLEEKLTDDEAVVRVFRMALSRDPTAKESARFRRQLVEEKQDRRAALEDLLWAVLTSREFMFNH